MSKEVVYRPTGVCSREMRIALTEDGVIEDIAIVGGCDGNLKGIVSLVRGMRADEAAAKLEGITCGSKPTSCPDQIARALRQAQHV